MATIAVELCHEYYRTAFYPKADQVNTDVIYVSPSGCACIHSGTRGNDYQDVTVLTEDLRTNEESPAVASIISDGSIIFGYNRDHSAEIRHIFDPEVILSSEIASVGDKTYSGEDIMAAFFLHLKSVCEAIQKEVVTEICVIIPDNYVREKYILTSAAKTAGLRIRLFRTCDALAYAYINGNDNVTPDSDIYFSTINIGYHGVTVSSHEYCAKVITSPASTTVLSGFTEYFIRRIASKILVHLFQDGFWCAPEKAADTMDTAYMLATAIAKGEEKDFPFSVPLSKFGPSCCSPLVFTWADMLDLFSLHIDGCFDNLSTSMQTYGYDAEPWPKFTDTLLVTGEGCAYPALLKSLLDEAEKHFEHVHLCTDEPYALVETVRYRASGRAPDTILLMSFQDEIFFETDDGKEVIFDTRTEFPVRRRYELEFSKSSRPGIVIYEGRTPILRGGSWSRNHTKATLLIDVETNSTLDATLTFEDGTTYKMTHDKIEIALDSRFSNVKSIKELPAFPREV